MPFSSEQKRADFSRSAGCSELPPRSTILSDNCTGCGICLEECAFLRKYGTPGKIAASYDKILTEPVSLPFECSLCGLCSALCPAGLKPSEMILAMRRKITSDGIEFHEHAPLRSYEKLGSSRRFTYYALPDNCTTVFFPGCGLAGIRPQRVWQVFNELRKSFPTLGIALDCCMKPSNDLGDASRSGKVLGEIKKYLIIAGVQELLTACPNCNKAFSGTGEGLKVRTIYEKLNGLSFGSAAGSAGVTVHDPCSLRFQPQIHEAVRELLFRSGLTVLEMEHTGVNTICCGEGGGVRFLAPELAQRWASIRKEEAGGRTVVTYCAGCAAALNPLTPTVHLLDILFEPAPALAGKTGIPGSPLTYWNRLKLKRRFKKNVPAGRTREWTHAAEKTGSKHSAAKMAIFLLCVAAVIIAVATGASGYMENDFLKRWIGDFGFLTPLIYVLFYSVAPSLLLPGLPITVAGGILFGPVNGVIYAITGATAGSCVSFFLSRYFARDWVASMLRGTGWQRLDRAVENDGWKVVLFTRLIPLFPFNLLNFAFGLTKIRFAHYAIATFFGMLPACISFVVFSSSLPDLIRGHVSPLLVAGACLVALTSITPLFYRFLKKRRHASFKAEAK
jgi:uncharacterized membrane protein YdjX (TVP38/TMEM64 family)/Fe-S oxidoreductase